MFCTKCGKEIDEDAVFCPECGEKVSKTRKEGMKTAVKDSMSDKGFRKFIFSGIASVLMALP